MNRILPPPSATLDIDILRSVTAIAEGGSVAAAAQRVGRTPAAISMQVRKLEDMLGRALFERTRRGMTPTAEGERLLEYARRMIDLNREAMQAFSAPELQGVVRVGLIDSFRGDRLTRVLGGFARSHAQVTVNVSVASTVELVARQDAGALDLILLTPGGSEAMRDGDIVLHEETLAWLARAGGRATRQRPIPLAVANEGCAWRRAAVEAIHGIDGATRIAYVSDFDEGQLAAVRADLAVAPMPRSYLEPGLVELGAREGFPPMGICRLAMRLHGDAPGAARALAARFAELYGKVLANEAA